MLPPTAGKLNPARIQFTMAWPQELSGRCNQCRSSTLAVMAHDGYPERAKLSEHLAKVGATERTNRNSPTAISRFQDAGTSSIAFVVGLQTPRPIRRRCCRPVSRTVLALTTHATPTLCSSGRTSYGADVFIWTTHFDVVHGELPFGGRGKSD